ncbi:alpha/beta fold hydrolase [Aquibium sp. ELW1220]|uniref:PHA/PHB synthase family protein n=1 Tax=Aquibium sp. ELW1220 TaxID=2976766 RepID=UPI0025B1E17A|nr:alpha/beta fold hydrolase [Aquibium sp. ELW1220]MDN2579697.1 alpha/beta fold hydrolase [Aquibium sp. ELW1220]
MRGARRKAEPRSLRVAASESSRKRGASGTTASLPTPWAAASASGAGPSSAAGTAPARRDVFRDVDRFHHAMLAGAFMGISPISLLGAWQDWLLHLSLAPGKQAELAMKGLEKIQRFRGFLAACAHDPARKAACITPLPQDRRFDHPGWQSPPFNTMSQSFLLWQQWWHNATTGVPGVAKQHERLVEFYSRQFLDMVSPSNFAATNPEIIERTIKESGANFVTGLQNLLADLADQSDGRADTMTDTFRPGREVAVTPGEVVFRNELIELIQYRPATETVKAEPVLIVPAWIMKYYILDLSPENSLIRHLVGQGYTVFCISWRNPGREQRDVSFDDYRRTGPMAALDAVQTITGSAKIHGVGYCLGGTLMSVAAAAMARDGDDRLASLTLFAAQVDFDEPGELGVFIDESQLTLLEDVMWSEGYLDQRRMAGAFQMLRSQDLVWSRIVNSYLLGDHPEVSDLMAWNADSTRMPYRMHSEYLRQFFLDNDLSQGRFRVGGRAVHLEDISAPVFAVATETDHVAPWRSVFKLVHLLDTDIDFVLTNGGHNAGIVSEPGHPHRAFRLLGHRDGQPHPDPDAWIAATPKQPGSWWPAWIAWLSAHSSGDVAPPPIGRDSAGYPPICAAPGLYVLQP